MKFYLANLFLLCSSISLAQGPPPTPVGMAEVMEKTSQERIAVRGRLVSKDHAVLSPRVSGWVDEILVEEGQMVKKGERLMSLDDELAEQKVREIEFQMTTLRVQLETTTSLHELQVEEENSLLKASEAWPGSVSDRELRAARQVTLNMEGEMAQFKSEIQRSSSLLKQAEIGLENHQLRAPFDGQVILRQAALGESLAPGAPALELLAVDQLKCHLDVPSAQLKAVQNATLKSLTLDIQGEQVMFDQPELLKRVDLQSDTFVLIAHQKGRDVSLAEGMAVEANLPIGEKVAHKMVPVDAILKNDVGSFVYKVIPAGQGGMMVIPVGVEVLFRIENDVAVQSEQLMKEDKVVVEGGERLFPMTPVKAKGE